MNTLQMARLWLLLLWFPVAGYAQCDLEILDVDLIGGSVTIAFNNTENCGGTAGPDGIAEIQFGFQALDDDCNAMNQGWDFPFGFSIPDESNHPGWIYSATTTESATNWTNLYDESIDPPYYTGDTITFPLYNQYQSDCVDGPFAAQLYCNVEGCIDYWLSLDLSVQVVIWQISYGPTMYAEDGGWAEVGPIGDGTATGNGVYDDDNWQDNWVIVGPCGEPLPEVIIDTVYIELPPDTVVITEYDTIPVAINWYFYDTTYIYVVDTLYVTEYLTDTVLVVNEITNYDTIFWTTYETDTIYLYEYDLLEVDCDTGYPCLHPLSECPIYIANSFTPNNDGVNDAWESETPSGCWSEWNLSVYSRAGDLIWEGLDPDDVWLGGDEYYVQDGVYVYVLKCTSSFSSDSYLINGYVTLVR